MERTISRGGSYSVGRFRLRRLASWLEKRPLYRDMLILLHCLEALIPLLMSTSAFGAHYLILERLRKLLGRILDDPDHPGSKSVESKAELGAFINLVSSAEKKHSQHWDQPLFTPVRKELNDDRIPSYTSQGQEPDTDDLDDRLPRAERLVRLFLLKDDGIIALEGTLKRLRKGLNNGLEAPNGGGREERGVREL